MSDILMLALVLLAGLVLGALFFGGLWWTVRRGVVCQHPALLFLGSFLLRTAVVLAGFHLVGGGQWPRILACMTGFLIARFIVKRLAVPPGVPGNATQVMAGHAA